MRQEQDFGEQISDDVARFLAGDDSMYQDDDSQSSHSSKGITSSPVNVREGEPAEENFTQGAAEYHAVPSECEECEVPWRPYMDFESPWGAVAPASEENGSPWGEIGADGSIQAPASKSKELGSSWGVIGATGSAQAWLGDGAEQRSIELPADAQLHATRGPGTTAQQALGQTVEATIPRATSSCTAIPLDEADPVDPARAAIAKESATLAYENARLQEENALLRQRMERERLQHENALLHMQLQQQQQMQQQQRWPGPWAVPPAPQHPPHLPPHLPPRAKQVPQRGCHVQKGYPSGTGVPPHRGGAEEKYGSDVSLGSTSTGWPSSCSRSDPISYPSSMTSQTGEQDLYDGIMDENEPKTTRMMRNLPNNYTRKMLRKLLDHKGFGARYNLLYLPIDFKTHANMGYAFINFVTLDDAEDFTTCFQNFSGWEHDSEKMCEISWSDTLQGQRAHIERYRSSPVMHETVPDEFKPVLLKDGVRIPFPPPTRKIRAPRQWPRRLDLERDGTPVAPMA